MEKDILKRSKDSQKMLPYLNTVSVIIAGEDSVKNAGKEFLPMLPNETKKQYEFRVQCGKFTNVYRDIVETLASKPFAEEIKVVEGEGNPIPEQIKEFIEDVDGDGNNLTVIASQYFFNGINDAIAWISVDYPNAEGVRTIEQARAANIRPFWSIIQAINVLDARVTVIGGAQVLTYIKVFEPAGGDDLNRVRIFERLENGVIQWQVYAYKDGDEPQLEDDGVLSIDEIPFVPFITGRRDGKSFYVLPPLRDAVDLQRTLYKQESALEYAKIMTAYPMLSASGVKPKLDADGNPVPISVGPQTVLYAPRDGNGNVGSWSYVEPSAQSLTFLAADVKETKQDLRELGKQPLTAQAGLTVITTAYAAGKSKSAVRAWGNGLKDALENLLVITCKWYNITPEQYDPEVSVYDDYDDLSEEDFTSVIEMRRNGDISRETLWTEGVRRGILSAEFDSDTEDDRILNELPGDGMNEYEPPNGTEKRNPPK